MWLAEDANDSLRYTLGDRTESLFSQTFERIVAGSPKLARNLDRTKNPNLALKGIFVVKGNQVIAKSCW